MESSSTRAEVCVVCCRDVKIFAVGVCDHPICHECSTRMRVLCKQTECPICRRDLPKVYFSSTLLSYSAVVAWRKTPVSFRYKVWFENERVQMEFNQLLDHACQECPSKCSFRSFNYLKEHMRKVHEKYFCDLCVDHLHIFTFERNTYNRKDLAKHRRVGDTDNTSHRGHPLCEFCELRFMDNDELYKHLRRDHFFCHFCDNDGANQYYGDYEFLRNHFRSSHFLCEEDSCHEEKFTSVFRSEIDLKAHKSQHHTKSMSKAQAKQARTLEIEFAIAPRPNNNNNNGVVTAADYSDFNGTRSSHGRKYNAGNKGVSSNITTISTPRQENDVKANQNEPNMQCKSEFPTLLGMTTSDSTSQASRKNEKTLANKLASNNRFTVCNGGNAVDDSDFPSLSSSVTVESPQRISSFPRNSSNDNIANKRVLLSFNSTEDFPSLGKAKASTKKPASKPTNAAHNLSIQVSHKVAAAPKVSSAKPKRVSSCKNITLQSPTSPISDSGGGTANHPLQSYNSSLKFESKSRDIKEQQKSSAVDNDFPTLASLNNKKNVPTESSSNHKQEVNNPSIPFVTIKSKSKKKGKKAEENSSESDSNKKKKKENNSGKVDNALSNDSKRSSNNQENVKPLVQTIIKKETPITNSKSENSAKSKLFSQQENLTDFPALGPSSVSVNPPPPGFNTTVSHKVSSAPPGFNISTPPGFSNNKNDMPSVTFTSSCGQDYNMSTTDYEYCQPENFSERNQHLIKNIKIAFNGNNDKFNDFKTLSREFRKNDLSSQDYYVKCIEIFGEQNFRTIFPELLVLLPEIQKQQELLDVYRTFQRSQAISKGAKPKDSAWIVNNDFLVCAACQQVLVNNDFRNHMIVHNMDNSFPSLPHPKSNGTKTHIKWKTKS